MTVPNDWQDINKPQEKKRGILSTSLFLARDHQAF